MAEPSPVRLPFACLPGYELKQYIDQGAFGYVWKAEKVSIWQAGNHDNPFGQRLTCLMIAKKLPDAAVPMSLLADHPNVQFNHYRHGIGTCDVEMH